MARTTQPRNMYEEATLVLVKNPNAWPRWPFLPLKQTRGPEVGGFKELGYLFGDPQQKLEIHRGNIFNPQADDPIIATYDSAEELVNAGWVVD